MLHANGFHGRMFAPMVRLGRRLMCPALESIVAVLTQAWGAFGVGASGGRGGGESGVERVIRGEMLACDAPWAVAHGMGSSPTSKLTLDNAVSMRSCPVHCLEFSEASSSC
eukprot:365123-Chlamydomonas_euryale.AAC.36